MTRLRATLLLVLLAGLGLLAQTTLWPSSNVDVTATTPQFHTPADNILDSWLDSIDDSLGFAFRATTADQFPAMTEELNPLPGDLFVMENSAGDAWTKRKVPFSALGGGGGGTPGGTEGQVQWNSSSAFAGVPEGADYDVLSSQGAGLPPTMARPRYFLGDDTPATNGNSPSRLDWNITVEDFDKDNDGIRDLDAPDAGPSLLGWRFNSADNGGTWLRRDNVTCLAWNISEAGSCTVNNKADSRFPSSKYSFEHDYHAVGLSRQNEINWNYSDADMNGNFRMQAHGIECDDCTDDGDGTEVHARFGWVVQSCAPTGNGGSGSASCHTEHADTVAPSTGLAVNSDRIYAGRPISSAMSSGQAGEASTTGHSFRSRFLDTTSVADPLVTFRHFRVDADLGNNASGIGNWSGLEIETPTQTTNVQMATQYGVRVGDMKGLTEFATNQAAIRIDAQTNPNGGSFPAARGNLYMRGGDINDGHLMFGPSSADQHLYYDGPNEAFCVAEKLIPTDDATTCDDARRVISSPSDAGGGSPALWGVSDTGTAQTHDTAQKVCNIGGIIACVGGHDLTAAAALANCTTAVPDGNSFIAFCHTD